MLKKNTLIMSINFIEIIFFSLTIAIIFICDGCDGFGIVNRYGRGNALGYPCKSCNGAGLILDIYKMVIIIITGLIMYLGLLFFENKIYNKEKDISKYFKIKLIFWHKVIVIIFIIIGIISGIYLISYGVVLGTSSVGGLLMLNGFVSMVSGCILFFVLNK